MAWTNARTWAVGEVVTAAHMNTYISNNLTALMELSTNTTRLNPWPVVYANAGTANLGDGADAIIPAASNEMFGVVNWDALNAVSATVQWRIRLVYNISVIVPGGPASVTATPKVIQGPVAGVAAAGGTTGPGNIQTVTNTTGYKVYDPAFVTIATNGLRGYNPVWRSDRSGGSGNGTVTDVSFWLEVRNQ